MALLLSLETATGICSVCLHEGTQILSLKEVTRENSHVETITLLIQEVMEQAGKRFFQLEGVSVSAGPGSYTGLRVGSSTAKGLSYGLEIPFIAIPTLSYLARAAQKHTKGKVLIVPTIDARRMEVYTAFYNEDLTAVKEIHNLIVDESSFDSYVEEYDQILIIGNGGYKLEKIFSNPKIKVMPGECSARDMVILTSEYFLENKFADPAYFSPLYYKSPNITKPKRVF